MAQLKDLIVTGATRLIGDAFVNKIQITSISAPTSAGETTYGPGTNGQVLKSNGSSIYWTSDSNSDTLVKQTAKTDNVNYKLLGTATASPTSGNAAEAIYDANITINPSTHTITATNFAGTATKATQDGDGNTITSRYVINTTGANDVNTIYNTGIYNINSGSATNTPKNYGFGNLLTLSYRKHQGNTKTDWASQIYLHAGGNASATIPGNVLYFRTSNASTWYDWQQVAHAPASYTAIGSTTKSTYMAADGTITAGEEIIPIYRTAVDFTNTTPLPGAYYLDAATNPVTNASEYGTVLTLPWRKSGDNNFSSQLLISSPSGTGAPHVYVRRNTSTPALGNWATLLDNNNYTSYTVTKTGTGASGSWGISITGNAATATKLGSSTVGGITKPIYLNNGTATATSGYAVEYIVGTQTAATNVWTGATQDSALYTGKIIAYKLPVAGNSSAATLNLTLAGGTTTGAIGVKRKGTGNTTTHYSAGEVIFMVYDGTNWQVNADYDSNSNDTSTTYARYNHGAFAPTTALYRYQFLLSHPTDTSKVIPVNTTSNNTETNKTTITTAAFNPYDYIFWYSTTGTVNANTNIGVSYVWYAYSLVDLRYSFNTGSTLTANKDVYLVVQMQSDGTAKLRNPGATGTNASAQATGANAGPISQILPTSEDGFVYIKLGHAYDTYRTSLTWDHPMYWYKNNAVRPYTTGRGISGITRSGTTFTATRDDGSTFTFTQQDNAGVTSVRVQATSPVTSSQNTAQTGTLNTTIALADGYGDTKNPYASKTKNYVLAAGATANSVPSFRALVEADIPSISKSKISDFPTSMTPTSHTHGNLSNDGKITSTATIANGDKLVIVDSDTTAASKITGSSITFDGSTTTKALTPKGTWETFNNYSHPTGAGNNHIPSGGSSGQYLKYSSSGVAVWADAPVTSVASKTGAVTLGTLTIGGKTYNGSSDTTIEIADLGLASTTTFIGLTSTNLSNGSTTNPVTITVGPTTGSVTATNGSVVMEADSGEEYIWAGNKWNLMGLASSWALANHIHGNITNAGTITADTAVASSQHLVITDSNNKVSRSSLTLDTSKTGEYLTHAGTWTTPPNNAVTITNTTGNATYDVLFSSSTTTTTNKTEGARKTTNFTFNPSTKTLTVNGGTVTATSFNGTATKATGDGDGNTISSTYLKLSGGTMTGALTVKGLKGTSNIDYGSTLPASGETGQIFFLADDNGGVPSGGTTGQFLRGDGVWSNDLQGPLKITSDGGYPSPNITIVNPNMQKGVTPSQNYWSNIWFTDQTGNSDYAGNRLGGIELCRNHDDGGGNHIYMQVFKPEAMSSECGTVYLNYIPANNEFQAGAHCKFFGAVWNDYAEYRQSNETEMGRCVHEVGDGTLIRTTERLQKGCEITSDTFGFAIGKTDKCQTPTAASGRVLAYLYEDREIAKTHIGDPVCSGPNGTVSIMTEEEEMRYPSRIIGTISEVPNYDIWEAGHEGDHQIKVNGRIWIRVR